MWEEFKYLGVSFMIEGEKGEGSVCCCREEKAELKGNQVRGLGSVQKNENAERNGSLKVKLLLFWIERRQLRWFGHLCGMPPTEGVLGKSNWEETSGQTQGTHLSAGMGTPWHLPRMTWRRWLGTGRSVHP